MLDIGISDKNYKNNYTYQVKEKRKAKPENFREKLGKSDIVLKRKNIITN